MVGGADGSSPRLPGELSPAPWTARAAVATRGARPAGTVRGVGHSAVAARAYHGWMARRGRSATVNRRAQLLAVAALLIAISLLVVVLADTTRTGASGARPAAGSGPSILWEGDMEEGSLADWSSGDAGGEFNSDGGDTAPSRRRAHTGSWSARATLRQGSGGTRLFRWGEARAQRDLLYETWLYFPRGYRLTGNPRDGRYWVLFQFKSRDESDRNDPIWFLNVRSRRVRDGRGGSRRIIVPELVWWSRSLEGPREGERGYRAQVKPTVRFPIGRWFRIRARLRQSKDFDGILQFWLNSRKIFEKRRVRTGYANCEHNPWCVDQAWSVNLYSDGVVPRPVMYLDDGRIMRP